MIVVDKRATRRWASVGIAVAVMAAVGCGQEEEDPPEPPQFGSPSIACADSQDPDVDGQIITAVSIEVTDPDRDLASDELEGTFDSLPISLTDEDADQRFEWQPSDMENRIRCGGEHHLVVHASDAEGNEATFDERITQDEAS